MERLFQALRTPERIPFDAVVLDAGRYWACDQGVWYSGASPTGPMTVADQRPPHIDQVPPTVHIYHTRHVYVYRSTPQVVFVGYTSRQKYCSIPCVPRKGKTRKGPK